MLISKIWKVKKKTANISFLPGMGMTSDPCAWSHASDNWPTVQPFLPAKTVIASTNLRLTSRFSTVNLGDPKKEKRKRKRKRKKKMKWKNFLVKNITSTIGVNRIEVLELRITNYDRYYLVICSHTDPGYLILYSWWCLWGIPSLKGNRRRSWSLNDIITIIYPIIVIKIMNKMIK